MVMVLLEVGDVVDVARISAGGVRWEQAGWLLGHPFAAAPARSLVGAA